MNAFKKSHVLNRQCLRNKIEELSPLLLNQFNLGISNPLFQATWSYYASGCQERLTSIRRRIEQNAKIVVPTAETRTQLHKNLNIESSLPPGVDFEDHIYHEFASCFCSSDEDPAKAKKPPKRSTVQKGLNAVQYPTPNQWNSWKREEREVRQMLKQSFDPYRAEELTSKLQKLRKLISRRPLIVLPVEPEEPKKAASKKIKRRVYIKTQKQPEVIPKPGPYFNWPSTAPMKTTKFTSKAARIGKLSKKDTSQVSKSSLTNPENKHSSLETTSNISKRSRDALGLNFKIVILPENHFEAKLSDNEGPRKLKTSSRKELSIISQVSKLRGDNSPAKVKNKRDKLKKHAVPINTLFFRPQKDQNENKNPDIPSDSLFFLPQKEQELPQKSQSSRSTLKYKNNNNNNNTLFFRPQKDQNENKNPDIPSDSLFFLPQKEQEVPQKSQSSRSTLKYKNGFSKTSFSSKNSILNKSAEKLNENNQLNKPPNPNANPVIEDYFKKIMENHDKEKPKVMSNQKPKEKPALPKDYIKKNMENLDEEKRRKLSNQKPDQKRALLKDFAKEKMENLDVNKLRKPFIQNPYKNPTFSNYYLKENMENLYVEKLRKPFIQNPDKNTAFLDDSVKRNMEKNDIETLREQSNQKPDEEPALLKDFVKDNLDVENLYVEKLRKPFIQNPDKNTAFLDDSVKRNMEKNDIETLREQSNQKPDEEPALLKDFVKHNLDVEKLRKPLIQNPGVKPSISNDFIKENIKNPDKEKLRKSLIQNPEEKPALLKDSSNKITENPHVEKLEKISDISSGYKPHKFNRNAHFWHLSRKTKPYIPFKPKRNTWKPFSRDSNMKVKNRVSQRSILRDLRQIESIRKEHPQNPTETYIPFEAKRDGSKPSNAPGGLPLFLDQEKPTKTEANPESRDHYDWPQPVGLKLNHYFKPYEKQANSEILWEKRKSSVFVPTEIRLPLEKRKLSNLTPPEIRIPFLDSEFKWNWKPENPSPSYEKTTPSSPLSSEDLKSRVRAPLIISDIIRECLKTYGSETSFKDTFTNFMKPNRLDCYPEIPIKEGQPSMNKAKKIKPKKKPKKKSSKKVLTKSSRREAPPCSLCNLVRRRQSELRPYMKRMQMQRQRLELKTYYTQKILKDRRCQETRKPYTREVLTRCYQTLKLCQELLELRLLQKPQEGQS